MKKDKTKFGFRIAEYLLPNIPNHFDFDILKKEFSRVSIITYEDTSLSGYDKRKRTTAVIQLSDKDEDDVFSGFNYETRHKIRKAAKIDSLDIRTLDKNISDNYKLYSEFEKSQNRTPYPQKSIEECMFFSAYLDGELVSQVICIDVDGEVLRVRNISSVRLNVSDKKKYRILSFISRAVMWEAIKYAIANNYKSLDLNGVNLDDPSKKGIREYKMGFGGELCNEYIYTYKRGLVKHFDRVFAIKKYITTKFFRR